MTARTVLKIIFAPLAFMSFFSCRQSDASVLSTSGTVVFDYVDFENPPDVRLSVFLNTEHEAQRAQQIYILSKNDGYSWRVLSPVIFFADNRNWTGHGNLRVPEGEKFSTGRYEVKYTDAQGNDAESAFILNYDEKLYESTALDFSKNVSGRLNERIVLFDKDMNIIYFGSKRNTWKTQKHVGRDFFNAAFYRKSVSNASGSLLFLLPVQELDREDEETPFDSQ